MKRGKEKKKRYLALQRHPGPVELVDLPLVHLLSFQGKQGPTLVLGGTFRLCIQQLRLDFLLDMIFPEMKYKKYKLNQIKIVDGKIRQSEMTICPLLKHDFFARKRRE